MIARILLVAGALLIGVESREEVCRHGCVGGSHSVSLSRARRAQQRMKDRISFSVRRRDRISLDAPFNSGLSACPRRDVRTVRLRVPTQLVGKSIAFAYAERMPVADIRVATSARHRNEGKFDALADPALIQRLAVRCFPTLVIVRSKDELELIENP